MNETSTTTFRSLYFSFSLYFWFPTTINLFLSVTSQSVKDYIHCRQRCIKRGAIGAKLPLGPVKSIDFRGF